MTESVVLSLYWVVGTVGSRYTREDKKKGSFGYKRFLFP